MWISRQRLFQEEKTASAIPGGKRMLIWFLGQQESHGDESEVEKRVARNGIRNINIGQII